MTASPYVKSKIRDAVKLISKQISDWLKNTGKLILPIQKTTRYTSVVERKYFLKRGATSTFNEHSACNMEGC